jgi:hypothetical protein
MNERELPDDSGLESLIEEVHHIFDFSERREKEVLNHFGKGSFIATGANARYREPHQVLHYSEDKIKELCIVYRQRFLPAALYCGEIPFEVVSKIKSYEHKNHHRKCEFFILASPRFFLLHNVYESPLLFASTEGEQHEFLCEWGDKLPWYLPILKYPYRNFRSMVIASLAFGFTMACIAALAGVFNYPSNVFKSILMKVPILVISSGAFSTIALIYGLITKTDFSSDNWKSRFFRKKII